MKYVLLTMVKNIRENFVAYKKSFQISVILEYETVTKKQCENYTTKKIKER